MSKDIKTLNQTHNEDLEEATIARRDAEIGNLKAEIENLKAEAENLKKSNGSAETRYAGLLTRHQELQTAYNGLNDAKMSPAKADKGDVAAHAHIVCDIAGTNLDPSPLATAIGALREVLYSNNTI